MVPSKDDFAISILGHQGIIQTEALLQPGLESVSYTHPGLPDQ